MNVRWSIAAASNGSLALQSAVLTAVMVVAYGGAALIANRYGAAGLAAASLAAGTCLASATAALVTTRYLPNTAFGLARHLLPMTLRTGMPLVLAMVVRLGGQGLVDAGFIYYLMGFYLLALVVEIPMSLPPQQGPNESRSEGSEVHG